MNTQPRHPKCRALPVELHPDIQFLPLYHGGGENQRFFCLWSFLWSKPLLCRFRQPGEIQQTQVLQGFAAFRLALFRIPPRHSQSRRATNCATPGYFVILSGWSYSPKPGAIPTSLHPDTRLFYQTSPTDASKSWQRVGHRPTLCRMFSYVRRPFVISFSTRPADPA